MHTIFKAGLLLAATTVSATSMADHNSVWGEGWASMPNDIHNTRIETMNEDSSVFTDFVQYGNGADSVNDLLDTVTATGGSGSMARGGGRP